MSAFIKAPSPVALSIAVPATAIDWAAAFAQSTKQLRTDEEPTAAQAVDTTTNFSAKSTEADPAAPSPVSSVPDALD